jgi:hypothetical protein
MSGITAPIRWLARSNSRAFLVLFLIGFPLRVGMLSLIPPDLIPPNPKWETGAVALSLLQTGEFANPYLIPTGPTAHMPPLQVSLFALLYKVVGYSYLGGLIRWLLVIAAHATMFALLPWLSGRLGMRREVGVSGGLLGALTPYWPYELESFSALALAVLLVAFLSRWEHFVAGNRRKGVSAWTSLALGIGAGVSFHLQPVLLAVVAGCLAFELWRRMGWRTVRGTTLVVLGMVVACAPWAWRNYRVLGEAYFVRSNFGLELYVGNHEGAHGDIDVSDARNSFRHPRTDLAEAEKVRTMGEARYMQEKREEAWAWISSNPWQFVKLVAARTAFFWGGPLHELSLAVGYLLLTGLAIVGGLRILPAIGKDQRAILLIPLLTYPLVYYVVAYMPRYGYPVRWILFLMAGGAVWGWLGGEVSGENKAALRAESDLG